MSTTTLRAAACTLLFSCSLALPAAELHSRPVASAPESPAAKPADQPFPVAVDSARDEFCLIFVPYTVVPGNHDIDRAASKAGYRTSTSFNAVFSPKRFTVPVPWMFP
jgi:hypothetical protein